MEYWVRISTKNWLWLNIHMGIEWAHDPTFMELIQVDTISEPM